MLYRKAYNLLIDVTHICKTLHMERLNNLLFLSQQLQYLSYLLAYIV